MSDPITIDEIIAAIRNNDLRSLRALLQKTSDSKKNAEIKKILTEFHPDLRKYSILGYVLQEHLVKNQILDFLVTHPDVDTNVSVYQYNQNQTPLQILLQKNIDRGSWNFIDVIINNLTLSNSELIKFAEYAIQNGRKILFNKLIEKLIINNWENIKNLKSQTEILNMLSEGDNKTFIRLGNIGLHYKRLYNLYFYIPSYFNFIKFHQSTNEKNNNGITKNKLHIYHKRMYEKYKTENQKINIIDIIVKQDTNASRGEYGTKIIRNINSIIKIKDQITLLAKMAHDYNMGRFDKNTVIRLITPEFMFYTSEPLYAHQFDEIINHVATLSKNLSGNLILVFSSFAVYSQNKKNIIESISNNVIHVKCGRDSKIDIISKVHPSSSDPFNYDQIPLEKILNGKNENGFKNNFYPYEYTHTSILLGEKITSNKVTTTSAKNYGYPIVIEIESGAKFLSIIDICITGLSGEGVKNYYAFIEQMIADNSTLIPTNISHIVTSNIVDLNQILALTGKIAYADALYFPDAELSSSGFLELDDGIKKIYPLMYKEDMKIHHPPFGSKLNIYICKKYQLSSIHARHPLAEKIKEHNINIIYGLNMHHVPIFKDQISQCKNNISMVVEIKNIIENYYPTDIPQAFYHFISSLELAIPKKDFIFILQDLLNKFIKNLKNEVKANLNLELVHELQQKVAPTDALQKYNPAIQIN